MKADANIPNFLNSTSAEKREMLISEIERINNDPEPGLTFGEHTKYLCPAFHNSFTLIEELISIGYKPDAIEQLNKIAYLINEIYHELRPWFRLIVAKYTWYTLPNCMQNIEREAFDNRKVLIEGWDEKNGVVEFIWAWDDPAGLDYNTSMVTAATLLDFAAMYGHIQTTAVRDVADRFGEHQQQVLDICVQNAFEAKMEEILRDYIKSGREKLTF
jgi:hypothetical protein